VDLTSIFQQTWLSSVYPALNSRLRGSTDFEMLTAVFLIGAHPEDKDFIPLLDAPFFPGYFGEGNQDYEGVVQEGGLALFTHHGELAFQANHSYCLIFIDLTEAPVALLPLPLVGSSGPKVSVGVQTSYFFGEHTELFHDEMRLLRAVSRSDGLTKEEALVLLSPCPFCPLFFPRRLLKSHSLKEHGGKDGSKSH
jgi:hypothetical protein